MLSGMLPEGIVIFASASIGLQYAYVPLVGGCSFCSAYISQDKYAIDHVNW